MPELNQLKCTLNLGMTPRPLTEYNPQYTNKHVSCFTCVPDFESSIAVYLNSSGYIAPGLAAFVFIDGQYQCNRNRTGLGVPLDDNVAAKTYEIDFRFRQKEEIQSDGTLVGRGWSFAPIKTVAPGDADPVNQDFLDNLGTVEVIVLRCRGHAGMHSQLGHMIDIRNAPGGHESHRTSRSFNHRKAPPQVDGSNEDWLNGTNSGDTQGATAWNESPNEQNQGISNTDWNDPTNEASNSKDTNKDASWPADSDDKKPDEGDNKDTTWPADSDDKKDTKPSDDFNNNQKSDAKEETAKNEDTSWEAKSTKSTKTAQTSKATRSAKGSQSSKATGSKKDDAPTPKQENSLKSAIPHMKKPYWTQWTTDHKGYGPAPDATGHTAHRPFYDPYTVPEYPMLAITSTIAQRRGIEAQIKTGRGARYRHAFGTPEYIDSMEDPYAVFTFHYRTQGVLREVLGREDVVVDKEDGAALVKKISRARLEKEILKLKAASRKETKTSEDSETRQKKGKNDKSESGGSTEPKSIQSVKNEEAATTW